LPLPVQEVVALSPDKGIFLYNPVLILGLAGVPLFWSQHRRLAMAIAATAVCTVLFYAKFDNGLDQALAVGLAGVSACGLFLLYRCTLGGSGGPQGDGKNGWALFDR
jgi:hypothetical protein